MHLGTLDFTPVTAATQLVALPVGRFVQQAGLGELYVAAIDPGLADTAAFCAHYAIGLDVSANCVIVQAKRGEQAQYAACMILATDRIDINNIVRRYLDARKISFAPMAAATSLTAMEYGGITPVGLPSDWPILVDTKVAQAERVIIGSGLRQSKLLVPGSLLARLPQATVLDIAKVAA